MQNCKRKAADKIVSTDRRTDGQTAMAIPVYPPPLRCWGYKKIKDTSFRGVILRNTLPKKRRKKEFGTLNLNDTNGSDTHWVAWYKNGKTKIYLESYGIQVPIEIREYLKSPIHYIVLEWSPLDEDTFFLH